LLNFNLFNKLTSSSDIGVMVVVPNGEIGVLIEENASLYRFTLINEGESVSPSLDNLTGSWYATTENHNYTDLIIPDQDSNSKWEFNENYLQTYHYGEIPKDEIELIGLPNL